MQQQRAAVIPDTISTQCCVSIVNHPLVDTCWCNQAAPSSQLSYHLLLQASGHAWLLQASVLTSSSCCCCT
jgi:hypothetical protein